MNRLRPRQPYHNLPSTENIFEGHQQEQQDVGIELQPRSKPAASKPSSIAYDPINVSETAQSSSDVSKRPWFSGWRVGTFYGSVVVTISLIINIAVAAWLSKNAVFQDGLAELMRGDCARVERLDTIVHLAINVLSTLMLSGSNYVMQVLVGPTREEVDRAHQRGKWLDIGAPSIRNLTSISKFRALLWAVLLLSSLPLHLMFNSAFYSALATHDYDVFITTQSFLTGAAFNATGKGPADLVKLAPLYQQVHTFENLTNHDCISAYAQDLITDRRNLIVVSSNRSSTNSLLTAFKYRFSEFINLEQKVYNPYDWICSGSATQKYIMSQLKTDKAYEASQAACPPYVSYPLQHASEWAPQNLPAEYCLSERVSEQCSFNANLPIIVTVIVCNVVKVLVMLYVVLAMHHDPLLVIGDAIASFLTVPDETTRQMCLLSRGDVEIDPYLKPRWPYRRGRVTRQDPPKTANPKKHTWSYAPSGSRRFTTGFILVGCIITVICLLIAALRTIPILTATTIRELGFGKISGQSLISGGGWAPGQISSASGQVLASIIIANVPQLILSLLYFNINSLLTVMVMADEWSNFAKHRKYLRVSRPLGEQRSTYFLQLPYRFAIPLIILSTLLHWLISRSIFLAVISEWTSAGVLKSSTAVATCGFSPLPIIITLCLGIIMQIGLIVLGRRKYNAYIPLAASCSAAIAAACHAPETEDDIALKPLRWGVVADVGVEPLRVRTDGWMPLSHCSFSSEEVSTPVAEKEYG